MSIIAWIILGLIAGYIGSRSWIGEARAFGSIWRSASWARSSAA